MSLEECFAVPLPPSDTYVRILETASHGATRKTLLVLSNIWPALSGSKHIEFLLKHELVQPKPSWMLDATYGVGKLAIETVEADSKILSSGDKPMDSKEPNERLLLHSNDAKLIAESVNVPEIGIEVERAVKQVEQSLADAKALGEALHKMDDVIKDLDPKSKR